MVGSRDLKNEVLRKVGMDIKSVLNAALPLHIRGKEKVERTIRSDSATADRDANGQMPDGQQEQHPPMSEDQLKKAIEHLKSLDIVRDQNLTIELIDSEGKKFVLIKEPTGKTVRRIPEAELWSLQFTQKTEKGQLLRKTA